MFKTQWACTSAAGLPPDGAAALLAVDLRDSCWCRVALLFDFGEADLPGVVLHVEATGQEGLVTELADLSVDDPSVTVGIRSTLYFGWSWLFGRLRIGDLIVNQQDVHGHLPSLSFVDGVIDGMKPSGDAQLYQRHRAEVLRRGEVLPSQSPRLPQSRRAD